MKWVTLWFVLLAVGALALACEEEEGRVTETPSPAAVVFDDPFSYCASVGTIDDVVRLDTSSDDVSQWELVILDTRWAGPPVPEAVMQFFSAQYLETLLPEYLADRGLIWRCFEGGVWGCIVGAHGGLCDKAETSREPNRQMVEFCQENSEYDHMPFGVTGHGTIYIWNCREGAPVIDRQWLDVDPRGFISENWYEIPQ